ncbi:hypothetical protein, partial [Caulobacter sp. DWP3-1-3b2]|uniref:hypothetical protein n=1 Tax=Caulobacter sp. DWP3-1-3b2 TaxID=2804643 RepID=UPI003CF17FBC
MSLRGSAYPAGLARQLLSVPMSKTLPAVKMTSDALNRTTTMGLNSINTNSGAMIALQNLN